MSTCPLGDGTLLTVFPKHLSPAPESLPTGESSGRELLSGRDLDLSASQTGPCPSLATTSFLVFSIFLLESSLAVYVLLNPLSCSLALFTEALVQFLGNER